MRRSLRTVLACVPHWMASADTLRLQGPKCNPCSDLACRDDVSIRHARTIMMYTVSHPRARVAVVRFKFLMFLA